LPAPFFFIQEKFGTMKALRDKIEKDGIAKAPSILKVDSFLNHQIEMDMLDAIGREFYERYKDSNINKIVTIEASGIAVACAAARYFDVPVVFAKKHQNRNMDNEVYQVTIHSFTKDKDYVAQISKRFIGKGDRVLIIDDFLAHGAASKGLLQMVSESGAEIAGFGIVIEKSFQNGGDQLRALGYRVESLAVIEEINEDGVIFKQTREERNK